jgi:hypothetical protein
METLAIIAYRQPVTRGEIEEVRGTALSQNTLDALLEAELITPKGRRDSPGRPTLWGTTPAFLAKFGLNALSDLPRREDLINDTSVLGGSPDLPATDELPAAEREEVLVDDGEEVEPDEESDSGSLLEVRAETADPQAGDEIETRDAGTGHTASPERAPE